MPKLRGHVKWQEAPNPTFITSPPLKNIHHSIHTTQRNTTHRIIHRTPKATIIKFISRNTRVTITLSKNCGSRDIVVTTLSDKAGPGNPIGTTNTVITKGHYNRCRRKNTLSHIPPLPGQLYKKWLHQPIAKGYPTPGHQRITQCMERLTIAST